MNIQQLENIEAERKELNSLRARLQKIEKKEKTVISDTVQTSSKSFPYTKHTSIVTGVEIPKNRHLKNKYRKMIKSKEYKLDKMLVQLEYDLNHIENSEIREIIRLKYNDNKTWLQIMWEMRYNNEDVARKKITRYLNRLNSK